MKELLRTGDPVKLSWVTALLAGENIETLVLDSYMSFAEGSISAIPRRLMVADEDFEAARHLLAEAGEMERGETEDPDTLLGGRVQLRQPAQGYRVAMDTVMLAASAPAASTDSLLDVGCGVGAAALCFAHRAPGAQVTGIEMQPDLVALAAENAARNDMADRVKFIEADLLNPPAALVPGGFDHVIANPPYLPADSADPSPVESKAISNVEGAARLADWVDFALRMAKPKGGVTFIHRADRLDELLVLFQDRAGGIVVFPLWPKAGREAKRVIVRARPGVKAPMRLAAGMVMHEDNGDYTGAALSILHDGGALVL